MDIVSSPANVKRISESIADPIRKAYVTGGFGLAIMTLGAVLMLIAFFWNQDGPMRYIIVGSGATLIFFTLIYVYLKELSPLRQTHRDIVDNKEMMDAIQQTAIELTDLAFELQSLAFKNANLLTEMMEVARPIIRRLPLVGSVADSEAMLKADSLSRMIVSSSNGARRVINDLKSSLVNADPKYLNAHLRSLAEYKDQINRMLMTVE